MAETHGGAETHEATLRVLARGAGSQFPADRDALLAGADALAALSALSGRVAALEVEKSLSIEAAIERNSPKIFHHPMVWQLIGTAPIDRGAILLSDGESVTLGWWAEIPAEPGEHEAMEGWAHGGDVCFTFAATHWMPLPSPPAALGEPRP
jgi:hypothetical protein